MNHLVGCHARLPHTWFSSMNHHVSATVQPELTSAPLANVSGFTRKLDWIDTIPNDNWLDSHFQLLRSLEWKIRGLSERNPLRKALITTAFQDQVHPYAHQVATAAAVH